ncbi:aldolase/citrate lyase family protein (plasmid) [Halorussus salilacus]|uniref:HpcH/HpaI aldolase family protein n=1 Tax=Halorussus salilacus TaxID=2953750 RepID=UPI0020A01D57|nr:aldolase/citrate lyase family protein [Halorussus salilacus]USZ69864.1 aldolase/citrate lyase family protein [Halorussus salilacus]
MTDFKDRLRAGEPVVGHWLSIGDPTVAELCARDADFVVIDTEHAPTGLESVANAARAVEAAGDAAALARVAWNDPVRIKRVLDTGVSGVLVPMVETPEEAREAVEAVRYPPEGVRGIAGSRANDYGRDLGEAVESAGGDLVTVVQVETERAVENAGAIAAVEGIDALLVGPADLSGSLGVFGEYDSERFESAVSAVLDAAHDRDTPVGTLATGDDDIRLWADYGYDYQIVGVDAGYIAAGVERATRTYEDEME